ncbi:uncharacterized protein ACNS7B_003940 [Menidia menidia]
MKRRCFPLKGDHNLLTPDTQPPSGARLRVQERSGGVASLPYHLSGGAGLGRQGPAPPPRRLRFEDESDMEVEWRYRERQQQRRWAGPRGAGPRGAGPRGGAALGPKPDLSLYLYPPAVARRGQQGGRAGGGGGCPQGGAGVRRQGAPGPGLSGPTRGQWAEPQQAPP